MRELQTREMMMGGHGKGLFSYYIPLYTKQGLPTEDDLVSEVHILRQTTLYTLGCIQAI